MKTKSWVFNWAHNGQNETLTITAKNTNEAFHRFKNIFIGLMEVGDSVSSWISIQNQQTQSMSYIKPQHLITEYKFVDNPVA
jgi:hypothetical protein